MLESGRASDGLTPVSAITAQRVFFALWPDQSVREALADISRRLYAACGGRVARPDSLHMTLAFIGAAPQARVDQLRALAAELRWSAVTLELDTVGCWRHNHIAWLAPRAIPQDLTDLVMTLQARLKASEFQLDERPFAPHVTLVRKTDCKRALPACAAVRWEAGEFVLVQSITHETSAEYRIIGRWGCG